MKNVLVSIKNIKSVAVEMESTVRGQVVTLGADKEQVALAVPCGTVENSPVFRLAVASDFIGADGKKVLPSVLVPLVFANTVIGGGKVYADSIEKYVSESGYARNLGRKVEMEIIRRNKEEGDMLVTESKEIIDMSHKLTVETSGLMDFWTAKPYSDAQLERMSEVERVKVMHSQRSMLAGITEEQEMQVLRAFKRVWVVSKEAVCQEVVVNLPSGDQDVLWLPTPAKTFGKHNVTANRHEVNVAEGRFWLRAFKVDAPSVSLQRQGNLACTVSETDMYEELLSNNTNFYVFAKLKEGWYTVDASKDYKRFGLNQSNSLPSGLGEALGKHVELKAPYLPEQLKNMKGAKVFHSCNTGFNALLCDDFEVKNLEVETLVTRFLETDTGSFTINRVEKVKTTINRNATDGAMYVSERIASFFEKELSQRVRGGVTVRINPFGKGLMVVVPELEKHLGVDMVLFEGARKGNLDKAFLEGTLEFNIMLKTRTVEEGEQSWLSLQAERALELPETVMASLANATLKTFNAAQDGDLEALNSILKVSSEDVTVENVEDIHRSLAADGNSTVDYLAADGLTAVKSADLRRRASDLVASTAKKVTTGQVLVDAAMRHMIVDPYAIMMVMATGKLSATVQEIEEIVPGFIKANEFMIVRKEDGKLVFADKEAVLVRYPCLVKNEIRKLQASTPEGLAGEYYSKWMKEGYFQGLIFFSLADMNPEGMSGADYDGDTCLVIFEEILVNNFNQNDLFLDASIKEYACGKEELIMGCPESGSQNVPAVEDLITPAVAYRQDGWKVSFQAEDLEKNPKACHDVFYALYAEHILRTLKPSEIGRFTNVLMTMGSAQSEIRQEVFALKGHLQENPESAELVNEIIADRLVEFNFFKEQKLYLTAIVRWEIDAAKHGGAYKPLFEELMSVLDGKSWEDVEETLWARLFAHNA